MREELQACGCRRGSARQPLHIALACHNKLGWPGSLGACWCGSLCLDPCSLANALRQTRAKLATPGCPELRQHQAFIIANTDPHPAIQHSVTHHLFSRRSVTEISATATISSSYFSLSAANYHLPRLPHFDDFLSRATWISLEECWAAEEANLVVLSQDLLVSPCIYGCTHVRELLN